MTGLGAGAGLTGAALAAPVPASSAAPAMAGAATSAAMVRIRMVTPSVALTRQVPGHALTAAGLLRVLLPCQQRHVGDRPEVAELVGVDHRPDRLHHAV